MAFLNTFWFILIRKHWTRHLFLRGSIEKIHVTQQLLLNDDSTLGNPGRLRPGLETIFVERHQFENSRHSIKMFRSLAVSLAFVVALVSADAVLELGDADFDATLEEHDTALVMFYAPW